MVYISNRNRKREKDAEIAAKNRRELIAAGFKRRDLLKLGLLTSAGMLIPKKGLSAHPLTSAGYVYDGPNSPPTRSAVAGRHVEVSTDIFARADAAKVFPQSVPDDSRRQNGSLLRRSRQG